MNCSPELFQLIIWSRTFSDQTPHVSGATQTSNFKKRYNAPFPLFSFFVIFVHEICEKFVRRGMTSYVKRPETQMSKANQNLPSPLVMWTLCHQICVYPAVLYTMLNTL